MMLSLLKWSNLLLVLLSLVTLLAPYANPVYFWPLSITGLFFPWFLLLHLVFIGFWIYRKHWYFVFSLGWIIMNWNHFDSLVGFSTSSPSSESLSALSLNCHSFISPDTNKGPNAKEWEKLIEEIKDIDFLFFQEFPRKGRYPGSGSAVAKKLFARHWPYQYTTNGGRLAMLSKYPLSGKKVDYFDGAANGYMMATAKVADKKIRLINIHLQSNRITGMADDLDAKNIQEKETLGKIVEMLRRYKNASIKRAKQSREIAAVIGKNSNLLILGGDFNDTPLSYAYYSIDKQLRDGFRAKGSGIGTTYLGKLPGLRIDYIFFGKGLFIDTYRHRKTPFSDHKMVLSHFRIQ